MHTHRSTQITSVPATLRATDRCDDERELLRESAGMMSAPGLVGQLADRVFHSAEQRAQRQQLVDALNRGGERIQHALLRKQAELSRLTIGIRYQTEVDKLRIAHRQQMNELSQVSEDRLAASLNSLFAAKKEQLEKLTAIDGDEALARQAEEYISLITLRSAEELIARNSKLG